MYIFKIINAFYNNKIINNPKISHLLVHLVILSLQIVFRNNLLWLETLIEIMFNHNF